MHRFLLFLVMALPALPQRFEFGLRAEWPLTSPFLKRESFFAPRHPALGLSLRAPLTRSFALRVSPTWQRLSLDGRFPSLPTSDSRLTQTANRWQLPLLAEYSRWQHVRPALGPTLSTLTQANGESTLFVAPGFGTPSGYINRFSYNQLGSRTVPGLTAEVEFPWATPIGTLAPNLRYTRWLAKHYGYFSPLNEATVGLSLRWHR